VLYLLFGKGPPPAMIERPDAPEGESSWTHGSE
jgi:hypothetical protein